MIASENSLCTSCKHFVYCVLTHDKTFIWSCSDYTSAITTEQDFEEMQPTGTHGMADNEMTLV